MKYLLLFLFITLCSCIEIKTKLGNVKGVERKSRDGNTFYAFTSIPYAKPPVGKLRLKNPEPIGPWSDTLDATKKMSLCTQVVIFSEELKKMTLGQEDCLHLNIYTPEIKPKEKRSVFVFIHGGGFRLGNVGPEQSPNYLMDGNIVLVELHYRLGALGFLSTGDSVIPGNFGLKDQAMALHWVKDNIEDYGGDGNSITIFGESAGAASTHYLMMSPLTRDIVKGAISQSGAANRFWGIIERSDSLSRANLLIEIVGCKEKTGNALLECLQSVSPVELTRSELQMQYWDIEPLVVFGPVQELPGEGAFLPFDPFKQETKIPWLTGVNSAEGVIKIIFLLGKDSTVRQFIDNIDEYIGRHLSLELSNPKSKATIKLIKSKYFPEPITVQSATEGMKNLFSDGLMLYPMIDALRRHKGPAYVYYYDYRAGSTYVDIVKVHNEDLGVSHADDLLTLFNFTEMFPKTKPGEENVSKTMVRLWTNFAKYQTPTIEGDTTEWPKYDTMGRYLHITDELSIKRHLHSDISDWWFNLPSFKISEKIEL